MTQGGCGGTGVTPVNLRTRPKRGRMNIFRTPLIGQRTPEGNQPARMRPMPDAGLAGLVAPAWWPRA